MEKFNCFLYFSNIHSSLKALQQHKLCRVSDKSTLEELISNARSSNAFFCIDDTEDGQIMPFAGGYAERKVYFVWILKKYKSIGPGAMPSQSNVLEECRSIYRDVVSRILSDRDNNAKGLTYIADRFPYWEIPRMLFPDATGLYFSITVDTPISLCINPDKWQ